jgi:hypothetical protein
MPTSRRASPTQPAKVMKTDESQLNRAPEEAEYDLQWTAVLS